MKFRALINDPAYMREFHSIITTLSKMSKEVVFIMKPNAISLIVNENSVQGIPWVWADIDKNEYFPEYQMEGVDVLSNNQIFLSFNSIKFSNALMVLSKGSARYVKIKLTNKQFPCLTIELETIAANSGQLGRKVTHDVPVTLLPIRDWDEFELPKLPTFKETLTMPTLRSIRNLVDKMKNLSASLTVYCNYLNGELSLIAETELATVASHYRNLCVTGYDANTTQRDDTESGKCVGEVSCRVNSKHLLMFFTSNQNPTAPMFCNVSQDHLLKFVVEIRKNVSINSIMYAVSL